MQFDYFKKTSARWNCLKKIDTLGEFDFCTNVIGLSSLISSSVRDISAKMISDEPLNLASFERLYRVLPLATHEYVHFLDSTSTAWGMHRLMLMSKAYSCTRTDENKFFILKNFYDHLRRLKFPEYYTTLDESVNATLPWTCHQTSGVEFTSEGKPGTRPIVFIRLFNSAREAITRTPISMVSLLENSAMAQEIEIRVQLVNRLTEGRLVEEKILERYLKDHVYNPELAEYSICAHLFSSTQKCENLHVAFSCSAAISRLVLNATSEIFDTVKRNLKNYYNKYGVHSGSKSAAAVKAALGHRNYGVLFYLIVMQLPTGAALGKSEFNYGVAFALSSLGISLELINDKARTAMKTAYGEISGGSSFYLRQLGDAGIKNFEEYHKIFDDLYFPDLHLPPSLLSDDSIFDFGSSALNELRSLDINSMYKELVAGQIRVEAFGAACL